ILEWYSTSRFETILESQAGKEILMKCIALLLAVIALPFALAHRLYAQGMSTAGPTAANAPTTVGAGTRILIGLRDTLSTKGARDGDRFHARTLEPITTTDGLVLSPGMEVRGHVDKVETARQAGRARLWLTFDEIKTREGWVPLIADLNDIPGVHSVRVNYD